MNKKQSITTRLPVCLIETLKQVSRETGRPMNDIIAEAVLQWKQTGQPLD